MASKKKVSKKLVKKTKTKAKKRKVLAIPKGYHAVTPYLIIDGAAKAIAFYKKAFGAKEIFRNEMGKKIGHAEIQIGDSKLMLADEFEACGAKSAKHFGGSSMSIHLYVKNVDKSTKQAISAGATVIRAIQDQFYGDRSALLKDPFGYSWNVSTHTEDLSKKELKKRAEKFCAEFKG